MFLRSFQHILELVNLLSVNDNGVIKTWHQNHKRIYHLATWAMLPLELRKIAHMARNTTLGKFPQWKTTKVCCYQMSDFNTTMHQIRVLDSADHTQLLSPR